MLPAGEWNHKLQPRLFSRLLRAAGIGLGIVVVVLLLVAAPSRVEAVHISGEMEIKAWARFRIPHGGTWRNRVDLVLEDTLDKTDVRLRGRVEARDGDALSGEIREATMSVQTGDVHWVAGRQVIEWGSGFLVQPTSLVNPLRYVDGEPERVPIDALVGRWRSSPAWSGTVVWAPAFVPATETLPDGTPVQRPRPVFDFSQWTLRADWQPGPYDVGFVVFRGMDKHPVGPARSSEPYRLGTTVGMELKADLGEVDVWVEGAYSTYDRSHDRETALVLGVGRTGKSGLYRAVQWHTASDDARGGQHHLMVLLEKPFADVHRWTASAIFDLDNQAYRLAPSVEFALSDTTTAALTVAYTDNSRGELSLPLSDNEVRFSLTTRF